MAQHAPPAQADAVALRLVQAMEEETDPGRLLRLASAFNVVVKNVQPAQAGKFFRLLAAVMRDQSNFPVLSAWAQAIENPPGPLNTSDLVNVLKYPNCLQAGLIEE